MNNNTRKEDLVKEIESLTSELLKIEPDVMTSMEKYILRKFLTLLGREKEMPKFTASALVDRGTNEMDWIAQRQKQRDEKPKLPPNRVRKDSAKK